ncbi:hypothetical protein BJX96DRAFT_171945 [Aspergillus floccosus]
MNLPKYHYFNLLQFEYWSFDPPSLHRWYTYDYDFGYNSRWCFFLLDYGISTNDDDVPVLCYEWTVEGFNPLLQLLQSKEAQNGLKATPFTPPAHASPDHPLLFQKWCESGFEKPR